MNSLASRIETSLARVQDAWAALHLDAKVVRLQELQQLMSQSDFWNDRQQAEGKSQEAAGIQEQLTIWQGLKGKLEDIRLLSADASASMQQELETELQSVETDIERHQDQLLFTGEYDDRPAIVTIYSGAGGVDAQDWALMLERMYLKLAENQQWKVTVLNRTLGQEAGIKNVTLKIEGTRAYGHLKTENGVHRLVRISPFDADHCAHFICYGRGFARVGSAQ